MSQKITGTHAIEEALKNAPNGSTLYIIRGEKRAASLEAAARATGRVAVKKVSGGELDRLSSDHRGAVLTVPGSAAAKGGRLSEMSVEEYCSGLKNTLKEGDKALVLILDGVTDPHNLGAVLRSADQFGAGLVILPERRSVSTTETVIRVSSGAAQYVPIATVTNLVRAIQTLQSNGFWVYGADMNGKTAAEVDFPERTALVLGSEGEGMRDLVRSSCDEIVSIPMQGHIDSLNVSVAAGILMYEFRRK